MSAYFPTALWLGLGLLSQHMLCQPESARCVCKFSDDVVNQMTHITTPPDDARVRASQHAMSASFSKTVFSDWLGLGLMTQHESA